ncbi:UNVERIFIED_CONTAM: hypothetical protein NCL1_21208 [Trichonephila clavipes]
MVNSFTCLTRENEIHHRISAMLLLLFLLSVSSETCHSQYVYGGVVPYDPHYAARRPVRRSAIEALERLRLPVARYFPQVDTEVAPAPYPWTTGDLYALPPQWTDEEEGGDYDNYEYESNYRSQPAYAEEIYRQEEEPEVSDSGPMYNDMMASYLMGGPETRERPDMFENVQRRSQPQPIALTQASDNNKVAAPVTVITGAPAAPTTQAPLLPVWAPFLMFIFIDVSRYLVAAVSQWSRYQIMAGMSRVRAQYH